jgi:UDP-N-acetylglucosamine 4,6-dehydratase
MQTTELARAIVPHLPHKIVGVRPGEKLHEVMITEDDARSTVELEDRFVILPSHDPAKRAVYIAAGATPLEEGFSYSSNTNTERLDAKGLQHLLQASLGADRPARQAGTATAA